MPPRDSEVTATSGQALEVRLLTHIPKSELGSMGQRVSFRPILDDSDSI